MSRGLGAGRRCARWGVRKVPAAVAMKVCSCAGGPGACAEAFESGCDGSCVGAGAGGARGLTRGRHFTVNRGIAGSMASRDDTAARRERRALAVPSVGFEPTCPVQETGAFAVAVKEINGSREGRSRKLALFLLLF